MVGAEAGLGVIEVDGVVGDPEVFSESSRDCFFAVEDELAEDVVFLHQR